MIIMIIIITTITIPMCMVIMTTAIARVHPVHVVNADQRRCNIIPSLSMFIIL